METSGSLWKEHNSLHPIQNGIFLVLGVVLFRPSSCNALSIEAMRMKLREIYSTTKTISLEVSSTGRENHFRIAAILHPPFLDLTILFSYSQHS